MKSLGHYTGIAVGIVQGASTALKVNKLTEEYGGVWTNSDPVIAFD